MRLVRNSITIGLMALAGMVWARAEAPSFDRYQIILSRKPFGEPPPPPPEPAKPPPPRADSFAKSLRLTMIIEADDGEIQVGIVDTRDNSNYLLRVGEPEQDTELVSVNFDNGEAVLRKGEEMALLDINNSSFQEINPGQNPSPSGPPQSVANPGRPTYAERRRARAEQMQREAAQPPPEPKYTGAELETHLHEYQMEVIRQGLPPLPIPLTPEQDAQLVAEGYLPPIE